MELYFAPLEGITTRIYRNTHFNMFGEADLYYAPFINPGAEDKITSKLIKDVLPEENEAPIAVQILCNQPKPFLSLAEKLQEIGYREINLNLGCPSGTVVSKDRGAGFLRRTDELDRFLDAVFSACPIPISVKTRIGFSSAEEAETLMTIYNRYPISMLIVHPRVREDFYKGTPDMETFRMFYENSVNPLCYNGDVRTKADYIHICNRFPNLKGVMIGRGAVQNPALFREIKNGKSLSNTELIVFLEQLCTAYNSVLKSDTFTMHKLKEIMMSVVLNYPEDKRLLKAVKKANKLSDLMAVIHNLPPLEN